MDHILFFFITITYSYIFQFKYLVLLYLCNNFDIAHLPFAHHKLQGLRSDAGPVPMKILSEITNNNQCEVEFQDIVRGKPRQGIASFQAPCTYHFRVRNPETNTYKIGLIIHCVPIEMGKCRAITCVKKSSPSLSASSTSSSITNTNTNNIINTNNNKNDSVNNSIKLPKATKEKFFLRSLFSLEKIQNSNTNKNTPQADKSSLLSRVLGKFQWLLHMFTNKFLDSDIWVHEQELAARATMDNNINNNILNNNSTTSTNNNNDPTFTTPSGNNNKIKSLQPIASSSSSSCSSSSLLSYKEPKYVLVSRESDEGIKAWRHWWKANGKLTVNNIILRLFLTFLNVY